MTECLTVVEKGIDADRIEHKGYGSSRPLYVPLPGKYHPENRRVVFIVEGLDSDD